MVARMTVVAGGAGHHHSLPGELARTAAVVSDLGVVYKLLQGMAVLAVPEAVDIG